MIGRAEVSGSPRQGGAITTPTIVAVALHLPFPYGSWNMLTIICTCRID